MSSKFSGAFVSLLVTIFAGCSPEPAWPDTSILRASLPSDFGSMAVNDKSTLKVFFDLESAFFSEEAEGAWLGFKDLDGYEYYALPEKTMEDLSPKVHLAMKGVVRWHKQQLELDPGYLTGDFESYTEMAIHWGAKELELLFQVCWEEQELMDAFVHAAQIAWSNGTGIGSEVFCKGVWQWLDQEPSLSQEEKDELLLRYPLRLDAGYMRFRGDLMNWVGFWKALPENVNANSANQILTAISWITWTKQSS